MESLNNTFKGNDRVEALIFPASVSLAPMKGKTGVVKLGAQNFYPEDSGAFTGEISPGMIKGYADYLLIGHSERRHVFGESHELIARKVVKALETGFVPVLCIGETLEDREADRTFAVIEEQMVSALKELDKSQIEKVVIAYEPVWAIGTGKTATPEIAQEVHGFIRKLMIDRFGTGEETFILYGGSVKPSNAEALLRKNDINGALIGGASLQWESFSDILTHSEKLITQED